MHHNYVVPNTDAAALALLKDLNRKGNEVGSRNGGCTELTHVGITMTQPWLREILLPERKANIAAQIAETIWVLTGRNDVEWLSHYLPRAADFSDDGLTWRAGYGPRLRAWGGRTGATGMAYDVDQLATVVHRLQTNPDDRRAVISLWDPQVDAQPGKDIACNNWLSFSCRDGYLDLMVGVRSNDVIWGFTGINAFEWSALLEIVAGMLGLSVGCLHFATTSLHMYETHYERSKAILNNVASAPHHAVESPRFVSARMPQGDRSIQSLDHMLATWLKIEESIRTGRVSAAARVEAFPEPMLQSWLRVLQWYWSGDDKFLEPIKGTRLDFAARMGVKPKTLPPFTAAPGQVLAINVDEQVHPYFDASDFVVETQKLHTAKHAAYGDSWKKRGEMLGIMANIARKIDRLGNGETDDETQADTAADLMVYLAKYATWIEDQADDGHRSDAPMAANDLLARVERELERRPELRTRSVAELESWLRNTFDDLEGYVTEDRPAMRRRCVDDMLDHAFTLARLRWDATSDDYQGADVD